MLICHSLSNANKRLVAEQLALLDHSTVLQAVPSTAQLASSRDVLEELDQALVPQFVSPSPLPLHQQTYVYLLSCLWGCSTNDSISQTESHAAAGNVAGTLGPASGFADSDGLCIGGAVGNNGFTTCLMPTPSS